MTIPRTKALTFALLPLLVLLTSATADAQRGRVSHPRTTVVVGSSWGFGSPWYDPYWSWGLGQWAPYPVGPRGYWGGRYYEPEGSVKLEVKPKDTEVYVDGYKAGTVDDFDGTFQRLRLPAGQYTIVLYREGTKSEAQNILVREGEVVKFTHVMQPLAAGAANEPRPAPANPPAARASSTGARNQAAERAVGVRGSRFGTLSIRVQPDDAEVLIDDEPWEGAPTDGRLLVEVAAGTRRVEVRKQGFVTFVTDVRIRRGDTTNLNVNLSRD
jgi:hypothetical protein